MVKEGMTRLKLFLLYQKKFILEDFMELESK
jgi:hypothetical protein